MALEDKDIFSAVCGRFSDQPIEFIMEQYEKAKRMNIEIEKRLGNQPAQPFSDANAECAIFVDEAVADAAPKKKYTKRMLKVKPQDAIKDSAIYCCICGEERQSLTAKHLLGHGISVEEYKKLCGYSPDQPLMSRMRLAKSQEIIARAQRARMAKKAAVED